jgi:hypothetical protein
MEEGLSLLRELKINKSLIMYQVNPLELKIENCNNKYNQRTEQNLFRHCRKYFVISFFKN